MMIFLSGCGEKVTLQGYSDGEVIFESDCKNCAYLCQTDDALFAISELSPNSKLHIFSKDKNKLLSTYELNGAGLCHISYIKKYNILTGAFYESGILFWVKVNGDKLEGKIHYIKQGNEQGQSHCAVPNEAETLLFSANIMQDKIYSYEIGENSISELGFLQLPNGVGPRHILPFGENSYYIITEYSNEILTVKNGELCTRCSTVSEDFTGISYGSALCMTKDISKKRFLYAGNRGENTIAVFEVSSDFSLTLVGRFYCGDFPRHIALVENDEYIISANQKGGNFTVFKLDDKTGMPTKKPKEIPFDIPYFVCDM